MRLINCKTLKLEEFFSNSIPRYAILSHTWGDEEVSFAELSLHQAGTATGAGYQKIVFTCEQATADGLDYAWVDTCCIDKSSSAELSEAINSMFAWYKNAVVCYAYLADVSEAKMDEELSRSRWFTRGWTLQELLAPADVTFYDRDWMEICTKETQAKWIAEITGIDKAVLLGPPEYGGKTASLGSFCVAKRMSWASNRETTRAEDMAYCLLGIFDVNMPLLYGEDSRAFLRLQKEIINRFDDDSILAWGLETETVDHPCSWPIARETKAKSWDLFDQVSLSKLLAGSPRDFRNCTNIRYGAKSISPFTLTNMGLQIQLPLANILLQNKLNPDFYIPGRIGLLSCSTGSALKFLGILLSLDGCVDNESMSRVVRVQSGTCSTFVMDARVAVRSTLEVITITRHDESDRPVGDSGGMDLVLVHEIEALREIGYDIHSGSSANLKFVSEQQLQHTPSVHTTWNPDSKTLTMKKDRLPDMIEFRFKGSWPGQSPFSIFMSTISGRATVREGFNFSLPEKKDFNAYVATSSGPEDTSKVIIRNRFGCLFQVSASIDTIRVYDRRLFRVNVALRRV
jgi:hypothetical protein